MAKNTNQRYVLKQGYFPANDPVDAAQDAAPKQRPLRNAQRRSFPIRQAAVALAAVLLIVAAVLFVPRLFPAGAPASWSGADLVGGWASADQDGASFVATVGADAITVSWNNDGSEALYWSGSFIVPAGAENNKTVISSAAPENQTALMASSDPQKVFTVSRNEIQFEASMLGVTRRFILRRH